MERRDYERLQLDGVANLKAKDKGLSLCEGDLDNISFGGFAINPKDNAEELKVDSVVGFELMPKASGGPLSGKGKIRYVNDQRIGVEFTDTDRDIVTHIIKRIELASIKAMKDRGERETLDFMPY